MTTPNEIPTTRTDAEAGYYDESGCWKYRIDGETVHSDFARTLERETIAQAKRIEELEAALSWYFHRHVLGLSFYEPYDECASQLGKARALLNSKP